MSKRHPNSEAKKHVMAGDERFPKRKGTNLKSRRIKKEKLKRVQSNTGRGAPDNIFLLQSGEASNDDAQETADFHVKDEVLHPE